MTTALVALHAEPIAALTTAGALRAASGSTVSTQSLSGAADVLVGLAVLVWICLRQLRRRPVRGTSWRAPVVLAAVGLYQTYQALEAVGPDARLPVAGLALLVVGVVIGAGLAVLRGTQVRVWREPGGEVVRQGTALTVVLWVVAVGIHIGLDVLLAHVAPVLSGAGSATILLYLGVVLGLQQLMVQRRAALLATAERVPQS